MLGDMLEKLQQMKQNTDNAKERLNHISASGESAGGKIKVICNGNRIFQSVSIDESLRSGDAEELEDQLIIALNRAMEKAEQINKSEMAAMASGMLPPNIMNLFDNKG